jgi:protein-tyrosine phosphatase
MKYLISFLLYIKIQIERLIDHTWRFFTGLPMNRRMLITPNLFLGGQYHIRRLSTLKELGVTGIVNMRTTPVRKTDPDIRILQLPTPDQHAPTLSDLKKGIAFIKEEVNNGGKVYIHCRAGEGRGPTMVIAYLISTGMTLDDAIKLIKKIRTFINPSRPQIERLKEVEKLYAKK